MKRIWRSLAALAAAALLAVGLVGCAGGKYVTDIRPLGDGTYVVEYSDGTESSFLINGKAYEIARSYDIGDLCLTLRPGDTLSFTVERDGDTVVTDTYTLTSDDFSVLS